MVQAENLSLGSNKIIWQSITEFWEFFINFIPHTGLFCGNLLQGIVKNYLDISLKSKFTVNYTAAVISVYSDWVPISAVKVNFNQLSKLNTAEKTSLKPIEISVAGGFYCM